MVIQCPKCLVKLSLPDNRVKEGARFRCSKCSEIFVYGGSANAGVTAAPSGVNGAGTSERSKVPSPDNAPSQRPGLSSGGYRKKELSKDAGARNTDASMPVSAGNSPGLSPEEMARVQELQRRHGYITAERERINEKVFLKHLPDALTFPLHSGGLIMLVAGSVSFTILLFFAKYAFIAGGLGFALVGGYIAAFMMKIVNHSAEGEPGIPDWPDVSDWWDDILCPSAEMTLTSLVSFSPLLLYLVYSLVARETLSAPLTLLLLLAGSFYYPIALLSMSLFHSVPALNPALLLPAAFKIFSDYLVATGLFLIIVLVKWVCALYLKGIFLIGPFIDNFLMLYLVILQMRILGLMYFANKEKLAWF